MGQEHSQCDFVAPRIFACKFADHGDHGHFKVKQATLVENHGHRRGCNHFRDGGQIEDRLDRHSGSSGIEREAAEGAQSDQLAFVRNRDGGGRKRSRRDRLAKHCIGTSEELILIVVSCDRKSGGMAHGTSQKRSPWWNRPVRVIAKSAGRVKKGM